MNADFLGGPPKPTSPFPAMQSPPDAPMDPAPDPDPAPAPTQNQSAPSITRNNLKGAQLKQVEQMAERVDMRGWHVTGYLGKGSYGSVYEAKNVTTKSPKAAIKCVSNFTNNKTNAKRLLRELSLLRRLQHPNIVSFLGCFEPKNLDNLQAVYYRTEKLDTDLSRIITSSQFFQNEHVQFFMYQLVRACAYMHSSNVIHRDIKPANLLVTSSCELKVCDFGLARTFTEVAPLPLPLVDDAVEALNLVNFVSMGATTVSTVKTPLAFQNNNNNSSSNNNNSSNKNNNMSTKPVAKPIAPPPKLSRQMTRHVVTRWYRAPELILDDTYNEAIDMWSCGCVLAELLSMQRESFASPPSRKPLFPGKTCYPLSADNKDSLSDHKDQLNVIFEVIGTPSEADIAKVHSQKAQEYLRGLPAREPLDMGDMYKGADAQALDLLRKLLTFDPEERLTAEQALQHPYLQLAQAGLIAPESKRVQPPKIVLPFEEAKSLSLLAITQLLGNELMEDVRARQPQVVRVKRNRAPSDVAMSPSSQRISRPQHTKKFKGSPTAPGPTDFM